MELCTSLYNVDGMEHKVDIYRLQGVCEIVKFQNSQEHDIVLLLNIMENIASLLLPSCHMHTQREWDLEKLNGADISNVEERLKEKSRIRKASMFFLLPPC